MRHNCFGIKDLKGPWYVTLDRDDSGKANNWQRTIHRQALAIDKPTVANPYFDEAITVVWYWHEFDFEALGQRVCLEFEGADYFAEAWLNGQYLGGNESAMLPFSFSCENDLRPKRNLLAVRVVNARYDQEIDGFRLGEVPGGRQHDDLWAPGHRFTNFGGLTGSVQIRVTGQTYIQNVFIRPIVSKREIAVDIEMDGPIHPKTVLVGSLADAFPHKGNHIAAFETGIKRKSTRVICNLDNAELWELDRPVLYELSVKLYEGDNCSDERRERFGMRDIKWQDGRIHLNGKPLLLRMALYNQTFPVTLGQPYRDFARRDVELAKKAGLNGLRMFNKPPTKATLDACDELGMLAHVETMASWWMWDGPAEPRKQRLRDQMIRMVKTARNHPSIFLWCCLNEPRHDEVRDYASEVLSPELTRLDNTRIVMSDEPHCPRYPGLLPPGASRPEGKSTYAHWYFFENLSCTQPRGYSLYGDPLRQIRVMRGREFGQDPGNYRNKSPAKQLLAKDPKHHRLPVGHAFFADPTYVGPFCLSEWGTPFMPDWDRVLSAYRKLSSHQRMPDYVIFERLARWHRMQWKTFNMSKSGFPSFDDLVHASQRAAAKRYEEHLAILWGNVDAIGYCLTSLEDSDYTVAGIIDVWRQPKGLAFEAIKEMNRPLLLNIDWQPRSLYVGDAINVDISLVHDHPLASGEYQLDLEILSSKESKAPLFKKTFPVTIKSGPISWLLGEKLRSSLEQREYVLRARLRKEQRLMCKSDRLVFFFDRLDCAALPEKLTVWQEANELQGIFNPCKLQALGEENLMGGVLVSKNHLDSKDLPLLRRLYRAVEQGASVAFLDHQIFGKSRAATKTSDAPFITHAKNIDIEMNAYMPDFSGFKPNPKLPCWGFGGLRYALTHRLLEGLPTGLCVSETDVYARVCATDSWQLHRCGIPSGESFDPGPSGECPCDCLARLGADVAMVWCNNELPYWYGADLMTIPYGKGLIILSTLNLMPNLGSDPAADRIVFNMLKLLSQTRVPDEVYK